MGQGLRLIEEIKARGFKSISITGLAKNAGKTVTLNYLIEEAGRYGINIGITSTGRDGETVDLVTNTQKPTIFLREGTYVATARKALLLSEAKVEILETTGIPTPMGEVVIVRVRQDGNIQIAGPVSASDMGRICAMLAGFGADVVLVDGAIDRKAVSSPVITDACIISTGAVLSRDMKKVIERTAHAVECYSLSAVERAVSDKLSACGRTCVLSSDGSVDVPDILTGITGGKKILERIDENTTHVYLKGAVTSNMLKSISESKYLRKFSVVVEDGTKIFTEVNVWNDLKRKGLKLCAVDSINVIGVTLNPVSPTGYFFDSAEFLGKMKDYLPGVKIIDVVSGGEED